MDTPSKVVAPSHRLIYRGSLALPDSHLLLDGVSMTVRTGDMHGSPALLNNSLALTLETLRGLPLHLLATVRVKDIWIESSKDILVDVHPEATLTRIYFENLFCLTPITSEEGRTEYGVRVSITENNDPDTPDLLIYGELRDASPTTDNAVASTSTSPPKVFHLLAARILPGPPPPPSFRLPRPDDPTPRRPPAAFGSKRKRDASGIPFDIHSGNTAESSKRAKTADGGKGKGRANDEALRKAAAETMRRIPRPSKSLSSVNVKALGKDARVGVKKDRDGFKVPSVPARASLGRSTPDTDVFGTIRGGSLGPATNDAGVERENKNAVKRVVAQRLVQEGIPKTHPDFKEVFQMCYHGSSFALRHIMGHSSMDVSTIEKFVDIHVKMYVRDAPR